MSQIMGTGGVITWLGIAAAELVGKMKKAIPINGRVCYHFVESFLLTLEVL